MDPLAKTPTEPADYAALSTGYASLAAVLLLAAHQRDEEPVGPAEFLPLGIATFALAKMIAKEKVETWVRQPFVEELPDGEQRPKGHGLRYAVGELLTCTRCVGAWSSLALVGLRVTRPREARVVATLLGASAVNDFLQAGFTYVCAQGNVAQRDAQAPARDASERRFEHSG
jgi:hypothetical protein